VRYDTLREVAADNDQPITNHELQPEITGIGSGTTYPDYKRAPFIVQYVESGVEVVTVVSEVPLSYCGMEIKLDTDEYIGEECAKVHSEGVQVGFVAQEQYGSKMLSLGGINLIKEKKSGLKTVLLMEAIANREKVEVQIERGAHIEFRVGEAPVINGKKIQKMRVGCGSAAMALFAYPFREAADEVMVIDSDLTAIFKSDGIGGVATSGLGGHSFTKGIATAATVFAENAGYADAAATFIGNRTNIEDPAIERRPAEQINPLTDIPGHLVTYRVGTLSREKRLRALQNGLEAAEFLRTRKVIQDALIAIHEEVVMTEGLREKIIYC
jgi:hypothetical protein